MKKKLWLTLLILSLFTIVNIISSANDSSITIFVEDAVVSAESKNIKLPLAYIHDKNDVGLSPVITVNKNGKEYPVFDNKFVADELGDYTVTYSAINSLGETKKKDITLTVQDSSKPLVSYYSDEITCYIGEIYKLPKLFVTDFHDTEIIATTKNENNQTVVLTDNFSYQQAGTYTITFTVTEKRANALSTEYNLTVNVIRKGRIYGFNDFYNGIYWTRAQAGLQTDEELYQVPKIEENTDQNYVHDIDGKSFKVSIKGKSGMNKENSWPRIDTSALSFPNLSEFTHLVVWVYNASPDFENLVINAQFNMSNAYNTTVTAVRGEWTEIRMPLEGLKSASGQSLISNVQFWVSGFEEGTVTYYLDDMYLI